MPRPRLLAAATWVLATAPALRALAADPADLPPSVGAPDTSGIEQLDGSSGWGRGRARAFVSSTVDVGFVYLRPQIAVGWGKPHSSWIGVEAQPSLATGGSGVYGGVRAALPFVDLRVGSRYVFAFDRRFLVPRDSYTRDHVEALDPRASPSRYVSLEAELSSSVRVPGGHLLAVASGHVLQGVPEGWFAFEESLHVVVDPPFVWRGRLGYALALGKDGFVNVGPCAEVVGIPDREAFVVRAGPTLSVRLTDQLEAVATMALVVASPDETGLLGADIGRVGLRWKWASGARPPLLPW